MTENTLPRTYKPSCLKVPKIKRRTSIVYAIGLEHQPGQFGMNHGPLENLHSMLDVVPDEEVFETYIIRFNIDGTDEKLYVWDKAKREWNLLTKDSRSTL